MTTRQRPLVPAPGTVTGRARCSGADSPGIGGALQARRRLAWIAQGRKEAGTGLSPVMTSVSPQVVACTRIGLAHHDSCSRTVRSADIARAVWLFTAPRLMPIAVAISASERSP